jgi:peptide/nickel transport system substrate-binding protein
MGSKLRGGRGPGLLALTLALSIAAAACADDDDDDSGAATETSAAVAPEASTTTAGSETTAPAATAGATTAATTATTAASEPFDPEGVLRYSADIANQTEPRFDPIQSISQTNGAYLSMLYDTLLRKQPDGSFVPALAEEVTQVDAQTLEVHLREGVTFTDGTPVDAEAARVSLLRVRDTTNPPAFTAEYALLADVTVVDDLTFRISLTQPAAAAYTPLLAGPETMIVSKAALDAGTDLNATPVGAGPFVLESYEPGVGIRFTKNPDYWDADNVKLAGIEVVHIPAGPQNQTALRAGQVDMIGVAPTELPALENDYGISRRASPDSYMWMPMCKTREPFDDVRVRQALNYAIDKDALNQGVLQGLGEPMHAMFPEGDALFPEALADSYAYDPDRARELLAEAGVEEGTEVGVITIAGSPAVERFAEIVQQYWGDVGVSLRIVPSQNITEDYYQNVREPLFILPTSRGGVSKVTNQYVGPQLGNVCGWNDPELAALTTELAGLPADDPEAVELWAEVQQIVFDDALSIFGLFNPIIWAYDDAKLAGVEVVAATVQYPYFWSIYVIP